jgi:hypothetical protein
MQKLSDSDRLKMCGRRAHGRGEGGIRVVVSDVGRASYRGIQTCGSVWACAECQHKIRRRREDEVTRGLVEHVKRGGGIVFGTLTIRHREHDSLRVGFDGVALGWKQVQQSRPFRDFRKEHPFGFIRAIEILDTLPGQGHGWHPHMHNVITTDEVWPDAVREEFSDIVSAEWIKAVSAITGKRPAKRYAVRFENAASPEKAGEYLCKLQEDGRTGNAASELNRSDRKVNRKRGSSFHPLTLLDMAEAGDKRAAARWIEFVEVTAGRKCIQWSHGLKKRLLPAEPELTDEEAADAAEADEAGTAGWLSPRDFMAIRRARLDLTLLTAVEKYGVEGFWSVLERARATARRSGWFDPPPQPWAC